MTASISRLIVCSALCAFICLIPTYAGALENVKTEQEDPGVSEAGDIVSLDYSGILDEEEIEEEFPLWAHDLRRAEIVAFGSLPFTLFLSRIGVDTWRWSNNDWNMQYAPWPLRGANAIEMTSNEARVSIAIAFGASALIALADHLIVRHRRAKTEVREQQRPRSSLEIEPLEIETESGNSSDTTLEGDDQGISDPADESSGDGVPLAP